MSAQAIQLGPFFDQGELCGAALLEHYEAGTGNLQNIWGDAAKTVTLKQPFISGADGVFTFYGDGNYKFIIRKADGTLLHTVDYFKVQEVTQSSLTAGTTVATASNMSLGTDSFAHWTGSTNVGSLSGLSLFYWAVADGNFTLLHSASLLMPDSRNRKVLQGDVLFFINEGSGIWRLSGHMQKEGGWTGRQGASFVSSATITVPSDGDFMEVSGATDITAITAASAGYRFRVRFTGTGLNIIHNATSLITPWGYDYRTVQNEIIEFLSLGSGNWIMYSLNGPKEQVGQVMSVHSTTAPKGGLLMDGGTFSAVTYPGLAAYLGGTTLPDDRGRFELMIDGTANRVTSASTGGANADTLGGTGGAQTHTLVTSEIPAHAHAMGSVVNNSAGGAQPIVQSTTGDTTGSTGGGGAHNNMPNWIARQRYIRF